jgi:hypothetical protein
MVAETLITKFQAPAFAPQGGASRRQANNQIIPNDQISKTGFRNFLFGYLNMGY